MSLLTPLFGPCITFASELIRTEAQAGGFRASFLTLNAVVRSSLDFFLRRHFKDVLDFDTSRTPYPASSTALIISVRKQESSLMMKQHGFMCVCVFECN